MSTKLDKSIRKAINLTRNPAIKRLGQNFLKDQPFSDNMIQIANVKGCNVIDLGAGPTTLSLSCVRAGASSVHAVEIDQRFVPIYERFIMKNKNIPIYFHHCDMLEVDLYSLLLNSVSQCDYRPWNDNVLPNTRIVGNLPFNVSIPAILKLAYAVSNKSSIFKLGRVPLCIVLQKETARDIMMINKTSRLSTMINTYFETGDLVEIPRHRFTPPPNVDAAFLQLIPRKEPTTIINFLVYEQIVKALFTHPNKEIGRNLKLLMPDVAESILKEFKDSVDISLSLTARQLSLSDVNTIAVCFKKMYTKYHLSPTPILINNKNIL